MRDPGIYDAVPEAEYHADPALSQSQAKTLLDCPARYRYELDHPRKPTPDMEFGTVVHALVLGQPLAHVEVDASDWRSKDAREAQATARASGLIPMLSRDVQRAQACAQSVREHPYVAAMLEAQGAAEQSMWWVDPGTGVECRGRVDWLTIDDQGTPVLMDLKTTAYVGGDGWGAHCAKFGYHIQAANYLDGYRVLTGQEATFIFVAVERTEPYFVRTFYAPRDFIAAGQERMTDALEQYARYTRAGHWPAYSTTPEPVELPRWAA